MSAASSTPKHHERDPTSPSNAAEPKEEEVWSEGDDDDEDAEANGEESSHKRKRARISRPISVSCERCKERKVSE